ncbi:MAG: Gfo/Idh/MocA family oxidoreductase [Planctomycetes bacterium]|nr:Gfo/Idh/MocA family oxidoreductase [Planctomycetota bacterium]
MSHRKFSRRDVLKAGAGALALPSLLPRHLLGFGGEPGASEQVRVAIIGLGGRAGGVVADCRGLKGMRVVAVSDCFAPRIGAFIEKHGADHGWNGYEDFRKMIETEKPDGVMVETTTHARAWITIQALQMGCDAYIEKPMSLTIAEGRQMVAAARRYGRVTQVGTQQRSTPLNNWASDLVKNGALGKVHTVLAPNFVGPSQWTDEAAQPMPEGGSATWWDTWTGQAVLRPYHVRLHFGWSKWWNYDGGGECFGVTGWGTHSYDQVNRALGTDGTGPVEVVLEEAVKVSNTGKFAKPHGNEDTGVDYHSMAQPVVGPRAKVTMRFASGTELKLHLDGDVGPGLGAIFIGEKGRIEINRNKISADPVELVSGAEEPGPNLERGTPLHVEDWLECIKSRKPCRADIEIGQRATTLCYLVNIAREVGKVGEVLRWDPVAERFTNCEEGNKLLDRERRKGWELAPLT